MSNMSAFSTRGLIAQPAPDRSSVKPVTLDQLENGLTQTAAHYWRMLRGERNLPSRNQLQPRDMRAILRNIVLLRVVDGGRDYEYRIVGDMFRWAYGVDFTGKFLSDVEAAAPEHGSRMRGLYEHVRAAARPVAIQGWVGREIENARFVYYETVLLPLGEDGETVDHILVTSFHVPRAD
ncbi:MAG: PAS domain-containing protein [Alphaproteobacteria bacterium]|nr:PAS domain-containing protein [Alphaproteobacteria bacterium]MBL6937105.1 PAS domain-containing protein [Alphaproteobacteria bacterium]MBL7096333.1 PAS domain-containing protein [Alphaproteobacteria bacterium]